MFILSEIISSNQIGETEREIKIEIKITSESQSIKDDDEEQYWFGCCRSFDGRLVGDALRG